MLVNASVYDRCCWTIFAVGNDSLSLSDFYQRVFRDCVQAEEHELREARVGRSKESLDSDKC